MESHSNYDPKWIAEYYNNYGDKEWSRLSNKPADRISFSIHRNILEEYIAPGSRVLEIGAGPGRFTQVLYEHDCSVVVGDISDVQLSLHKKHAVEEGFDACVESRLILDVCDLGNLPFDSFDGVVCFGGPLSYVFEKVGSALGECRRVCKKSGKALFSVMSLWGGLHRHLSSILEVPIANNRNIIATGDLVPEHWEQITHRCHMFRSREILDLADASGMRTIAISASNYLSINWDDTLQDLSDDSPQWRQLVELEIEACKSNGCLDSGTHIIIVCEV